MKIRLLYALVGGFAIGFGSGALPRPWNQYAYVALVVLAIGYCVHTWLWLREAQKRLDELVSALEEATK